MKKQFKKEELKESRQFKAYMSKKDYYTHVPLTWCVRFDLSPLQLLLYCIIRDATTTFELKAYTGSIKGLCANVNATLPTVRKALDELEDKGFIIKTFGDRREKNWIQYRSTELRKPGQTIEQVLETYQTTRIWKKQGKM